MTLDERARSVQTRGDLVAFVAALQADLVSNPEDWTNADLAAFLEAMAAGLQDSDGYYRNTEQNLSGLPPWKILADALMGARIYE
ncbi:MAG: DUF7660 family protein [Kofleriaceae bacterium]